MCEYNESKHRLTLMLTNRCTEARLALAVGSRHGAIVVCVMRVEAGSGKVVDKAL